MREVLFIIFGAVPGALARYYTGLWLNPSPESAKFPLGTFCVNCLGCALIGIFLGLKEKYQIPGSVQLLVVSGFLGAFTTFSGFSAELIYMLKNASWFAGISYVFLSNIFGVVLAFGLYKWISL